MYVITALSMLMMLASCDPLRRAMRRQQKIDAAVVEYLKRNPPKIDTMYIPGDTIYHSDTIVNENIYIDTVYVNDTVYITKNKLIDIFKTAYIRDTIIRQVNNCADAVAVRDENIILKDRYERARKEARTMTWAVYACIAFIIISFFIRFMR